MGEKKKAKKSIRQILEGEGIEVSKKSARKVLKGNKIQTSKKAVKHIKKSLRSNGIDAKGKEIKNMLKVRGESGGTDVSKVARSMEQKQQLGNGIAAENPKGGGNNMTML